MSDVLVQFEALTISIAKVKAVPIADGYATIELSQFNGAIRFQYQGVIRARIEGVAIRGILFSFSEPPHRKDKGVPLGHLSLLTTMPVAMIAARTFEENHTAIKAKFGSDPIQWPNVVNFTRVVRNAIAHRGRVRFDNQNAPDVHWHHIQLGPRHNGLELFGWGALEFGDLMFLIKEFTAALDDAGVSMPE